jgi:hypothetical protein
MGAVWRALGLSATQDGRVGGVQVFDEVGDGPSGA